MDWKLFFSLGVPATVVVAGWYFAHWLTARREIITRKREARVKALEAAYMRIATSSNRELTPDSMDKLELFVSEIQLYGTPRQIQLMGEVVEAFKAGGMVYYDALLADLRNTIREQLELEPISGNVWWFRFNRQQAVTPAIVIQTAGIAPDGKDSSRSNSDA